MTDARPSMRQGMIRQWARERNLAIGNRGRLPQSIVEAFQREKAASAGSDERPEDAAQPTGSGFGPLEPLARYLEPQFGNVYDWENSIVPYVAEGDFDVQPWTDEVRQAVRNYLLHGVPKQLLEAAFPHHKGDPPEEWVDDVLASNQPWEVAYLFHEGAVASLPTLDALIGHLQTWPFEDDRDDAADWLKGHVTEPQLKETAVESGHAELAHRSDLAWDLTHALEPPVLLKAWHDTTGSAPSDLTDAEWKLLAPFIPAGGRYVGNDVARLTIARGAINGMLYRSEAGYPWSHVPTRYGTWQAIYLRCRNYKRSGVFARMLEALQDNPEAARITAWLRSELGEPGHWIHTPWRSGLAANHGERRDQQGEADGNALGPSLI